MDGFILSVLVAILVFIIGLFAGGSATDSAIVKNCDTLGKFRSGEVVYICNREVKK